ncbi:MAG TPA: P-type conjugative transfer protein TrbG [Brevundimonas sp.]|uniref:P-type conjugative transfer protein TrbG n=1 Tax=Brevundimonas sp. TaxID=1871086 RepID=UPI000E91E4F0|nr:P-type conjugative transfer protein TrbG [Brevundimonas sp.]HBI20163.1 P-type conjugative transfer protein TrbG [Brevundimonas sp.]
MKRLAPTALTAVLALGGCVANASPALIAATLSPPAPQAKAEAIDTLFGAVATGPVLTPIAATIADPRPPEVRIQDANASARVEPARLDYDQSSQVYMFAPHALYQVYASPGRVTDIALQPGETLSGAGAIAAGDTVRWIIGESVSGAGAEMRAHILIKPTRPDLTTNLILHTDRRTYLLELQARPDVYMASIAWRYPQDEALALRRADAARDALAQEPQIDLASLNFEYRIVGDAVPWKPLRAFDDGARVFIEFSDDIDQATLPPLFLHTEDGAALVNYRIQGRRLLVDRLFDIAELRLVEGRRDQVVQIRRADARR